MQGGGTVTPTALLDQLPELEIVSVFGVGYDGVPVDYCKKRGLKVTNTPDVLTDATADLTFALILAAARRLGEGERTLRTGQWKEWTPDFMVGADVAGQTIGLVGAGRIAAAVARRAAGFGMRILYVSRRSELAGGERTELERLLAESDFVSLHVPLDPPTQHLISDKELALMKPTAILVNVARADIVDEDALYEALKGRRIRGATIDVWYGAYPSAESPRVPPSKHPFGELDNLYMTPHTSGWTTGMLERRWSEIAHNLDRLARGEPLANLIG